MKSIIEAYNSSSDSDNEEEKGNRTNRASSSSSSSSSSSYADAATQKIKENVTRAINYDSNEARLRLSLAPINPEACTYVTIKAINSNTIVTSFFFFFFFFLQETNELLYKGDDEPEVVSRLGAAKAHQMSDAVFDMQYKLQGEQRSREKLGGAAAIKRRQHEQRKRRGKVAEAGSENFLGPWALPEDVAEAERRLAREAELNDAEAERIDEAYRAHHHHHHTDNDNEEEEKEKETETTTIATDKTEAEEAAVAAMEGTDEVAAKKRASGARFDPEDGYSIFHLQERYDYQGRTFVTPPSNLKPRHHACFIPKRFIYNVNAHKKPVSCVRFFPVYGHLVASAGMDGVVKVWQVYGQQRCVRTYVGHIKGVRDVTFANDGRHFLTCSYDRYIKLWDTETGQVVAAMSNERVPCCVRFNPATELQNEFIEGSSGPRVLQWDLRTKKVVQEYEEHQGGVSALLFIDQDRKFVSSSEDKSMRIWEYGNPVPVKYINDPTLFSMPALARHPNGRYFVAQSLDNKIKTYEAENTFKHVGSKTFGGHTVAGNACQIDFSPDGKYLMSGDSNGNIFWWDWKTCKIERSLHAHDGNCSSVAWHPIEPSRVVSCGFDGKMKLWD